MSIIVDASIAVKWTVEEKYSEHARLLLKNRTKITLLAPDLLLPECINALHKKVKNDEIDQTEVEKSLLVFTTGISDFIPIINVFQKSLSLSHSLNHSIYDCIYLATAYYIEGTLWTADRVFYKRLQNTQHRKYIQWIEKANENIF